MLPQEAKNNWCPFGRFPQYEIGGVVTSVNRDRSDGQLTLCYADGCMMWRWESSRSGYCGLAGKPNPYID